MSWIFQGLNCCVFKPEFYCFGLWNDKACPLAWVTDLDKNSGFRS